MSFELLKKQFIYKGKSRSSKLRSSRKMYEILRFGLYFGIFVLVLALNSYCEDEK